MIPHGKDPNCSEAEASCHNDAQWMTNLFVEKDFIRGSLQLTILISALLILVGMTGCKTTHSEYAEAPEMTEIGGTQETAPANQMLGKETNHTEVIFLREGDVVKISFPGAANLDMVQQIRRDGKIVLPLTGELKVVGMTTGELEKEVLKLYEPQLTTKEVVVSIQSSSFPVFVTGAVLRPGKVLSDHPITTLEAILEAGGFDYTKANLKTVKVIRLEGKRFKTYKNDLKKVLRGEPSEPFYLIPGDTIFVAEKFSWF